MPKLFYILQIFVAFFCFGKQEDFDPMLPIKTEINIGENIILPPDILIGDLNAPVKIIDYSSFSCLHCCHAYRDILMPLYDEYIKSGKVLLALREFPLDRFSMDSSIAIKCYEKFAHEQSLDADIHNVVSDLFEYSNMPEKSFSPNDFLHMRAKQNGIKITKAQMQSCAEDKKIENMILCSKFFAIRYLGINGTPAIYINGMRYKGPMLKKDIKSKIDSML